MSVLALVVVNSDNVPVVIRTRAPDNDPATVSMLFHMHAALDIVDERRNNRDSFLGLLTQTETHKIYGFLSTTSTKILLMVSSQLLRDNEARSMLKTIHNAYIDATGNPFYVYGQPINSKILKSAMDSIFDN